MGVRHNSRLWKRVPAGAVLVILTMWAGYSLLSARFYRGHMPDGAGIGRVLYKQVRVFGFGPGGNETGLVVFGMDARAARQLKADPDAFFQSLPESGAGRCRRFRHWSETPYVPDDRSGEASAFADPGSPATIEEITNRYGFGIRLNTKYSRMLNESLAAPGSYIGYSRCGRAVLMPDRGAAAYIIVG